MSNLTFSYPTWYLLLCVLLGLFFAFISYWRTDKFKENPKIIWGMAILRFLSTSLIAFLLLSPLLKSTLVETKKPTVVIAQDESASVIEDMDEQQINQYKADFSEMVNLLGEEYEVRQYGFGNEVRENIDFKFADKASNLSQLLSDIYESYSNQNLGAVIMATDGIYNEGSNPIYSGNKLSAPIYTIAMGDTTAKKDLVVKRIFNNKIAYLGDKFTIQADIVATNLAGSKSNMVVSEIVNGKSKTIQSIPISIPNNDFFSTKEITLDANTVGVRRYRISLHSIAGEVSTANNTKDLFIDVLDARQKILLLAKAPHPDIAAIKESIQKNKNYQVETALLSQQNTSVAGYDFVVLHQIPAKNISSSTLLTTLKNKKIPHLFIMGAQTDVLAFNQAQNILSFKGNNSQFNNVQSKIADGFTAYTIEEKLAKQLPHFAPLTAPFGEFTASANATVLLYQKIGKVETQYPLVVYGEDQGVKIGVLAAEGLWKWKLFDYLQHNNHDIFDEFLAKMFQYLSVKEDKRKFRVEVSKNIFNENETIYFDAELYNDNYERVNDPEVSLVLTNSDGKNYDFVFSKNANTYVLNTGLLPVGNYTYKAKATLGGETLYNTGQFSVQPIQLELYETTADHALLRLLSDKFGGKMVFPSEVASLAQFIKEEGTIKPILYETTKTRSIINLKWIAGLLLLFLALEWFLRRYFGEY